MTAVILHALATGALVYALLELGERTGYTTGRTRAQKFVRMLPVFFVAILVMNLIWPLP